MSHDTKIIEVLKEIRDWPINLPQDYNLAAITMMAMAEKVLAETTGAGTPAKRFDLLMQALDERFPDPEPYRSDLPETRLLKRIDEALLAVKKVPAQKDMVCWLVELVGVDGHESYYHTGFTDISGKSRSTKNPHEARRYSTETEATFVAQGLESRMLGEWKAVEHMVTDAPTVQKRLPSEPIASAMRNGTAQFGYATIITKLEGADRLPIGTTLLYAEQDPIQQGYVKVIEVEKLMCDKLGISWTADGISIVSLIDRLAEYSPWLDIKDAPRDGSRILAIVNGRVDFFHWQQGTESFPRPTGWRDSFIGVYPPELERGPNVYQKIPPVPPEHRTVSGDL